MVQNELLVEALHNDLGMLKMTLNDMTDADLLQRPVPTANNGLWQLGHLIAAEAHISNQCAGKTVVALPGGFAERYTKETASSNDPAKLGTKADLLAQFDKVRAQVCQWVGTLTPADMAKPAPESMRQWFPTVGRVVYLYSSHQAMHMGQLQVLRRKLNKPILF